jgi:hypothetical protein
VELWQTNFAVAHALTLAHSFRKFTGRELLPGVVDGRDLAEEVFHAPFVLVSHDTEADPILNYGNAAALALWEMAWDEFTRTPSRLTAEAPLQRDRARLLAAVAARGFLDNYFGVRISKSGRRFRIEQATVWNLVDADNVPCGQAATFAAWEFLD